VTLNSPQKFQHSTINPPKQPLFGADPAKPRHDLSAENLTNKPAKNLNYNFLPSNDLEFPVKRKINDFSKYSEIIVNSATLFNITNAHKFENGEKEPRHDRSFEEGSCKDSMISGYGMSEVRIYFDLPKIENCE
jgi:hypothetical protein